MCATSRGNIEVFTLDREAARPAEDLVLRARDLAVVARTVLRLPFLLFTHLRIVELHAVVMFRKQVTECLELWAYVVVDMSMRCSGPY